MSVTKPHGPCPSLRELTLLAMGFDFYRALTACKARGYERIALVQQLFKRQEGRGIALFDFPVGGEHGEAIRPARGTQHP